MKNNEFEGLESFIEQAARKACEVNGLDPDEEICHGPEPHTNGVVCDVLLYSPRWKTLVPEVKRAITLIREYELNKDKK